MNPEKLFQFDEIKTEINFHNLKSGEIIFLFEKMDANILDPKTKIQKLFYRNKVQILPKSFELIELTKAESIKSAKYGLSTKPNYTSIDIEFSESEKNKIIFSFLKLFDNPKFYSINAKIFTIKLDLNDFWESGGFVAIDKDSIGMLWINDLYDKF